MLPDDIAITQAKITEKPFNARYDNIGKIYKYTILEQKIPLKARYAWMIRTPLDIGILQRLAQKIIGEHDFSAFSIVKDLPDNPKCMIFDAKWTENEFEKIFKIFGNRFLHKMVRSLVGGMVAVLKNQFSTETFVKMIIEGERIVEFGTAPPQGLCLSKVVLQQ